MEIFVWSERFVTGHPQVDGEHRELVRLLNRVGGLCAGESGSDGIAEILASLVDYAAVHFAHEEELMERSGCDPRHVEVHKTVHADFAGQIADMCAMACGPSEIEYLLRFLGNWLAYHILGTDQAMLRQLRGIAAGMTPAAAYAVEAERRADPATASLLDALNGLYQVLGRRNRVLADLNRRLEERVEQRTAELREANRRLEEDNVRRERAETELIRRYTELTELNIELSETREQLVQSEKLASIGQLAAGVAHEINNPIGYVHSNLGSLAAYIADLFRLLGAYEAAAGSLPAAAAQRIAALRAEIDVDLLRQDMPALLGESKEGIDRVKKIIQDLKDFSRVDSGREWQWADLHRGLESTLNIAASELKYKADVVREYGELPEIECLPSQLNQVFMNLLVNAAQSMGAARGRIVIRTGCSGDRVWLEFADNGAGMGEEVRQRVFDPFFTTKPVGEGTGLGLSLAYGIIREHDGTIGVASQPGRGTTFRIELPVRRVRKEGEAR